MLGNLTLLSVIVSKCFLPSSVLFLNYLIHLWHLSPLNTMAKPLTEIITAVLHQLMLYLVEPCFLKEADVTFGKCIIP